MTVRKIALLLFGIIRLEIMVREISQQVVFYNLLKSEGDKKMNLQYNRLLFKIF